MKPFIKKVCILSLTLNLLCLNFTFAIPSHLLDYYDNNDIFYYDPTGNTTECETLEDPISSDLNGNTIRTKGLFPLQAAFVDRYHSIAIALGKEYGIPWETVMAQGILESASGTSHFARERNNFFGIGAYDSNPNNAFRYATPSLGWRGYFVNIHKTKVYAKHGALKYPNDPYNYLKAIKAAGYASDPKYIDKVAPLIKAIETRATERGWQLSRNLPANSNTTIIENAVSTITNFCSGLVSNNQNAQNQPSSNSQQSQNISAINIIGNKNINQTALSLSWPNRRHGPNNPKPNYVQALAATGVNKLGDSCSMRGKSCDAFVATVLRYSGADPAIPCCGAARMLKYFKSRPDLYQEIPNLSNTSNLQPGDIRSKPSHVEIIVKDSGGFRIASASHCDRTADHASRFYPDAGYKIFRRKT